MRFLAAVLFSLALLTGAAVAECVGVHCAFSQTGPNRPPALEDQTPPDGFLMIFSEEPPPFGVGGQKINIQRDLVPVLEWRQARREFKSLADLDISVELALSIFEHTGGVPIAWESQRGDVFIAIVDADKPLYRVPAKVLTYTDAVLVIAQSIIGRGGCIPKVPGNQAHLPFGVDGTEVLAKKNEANCAE